MAFLYGSDFSGVMVWDCCGVLLSLIPLVVAQVCLIFCIDSGRNGLLSTLILFCWIMSMNLCGISRC